MIRYVALVWNRASATQNSAAATFVSSLKAHHPEWRDLLKHEDVHVLHLPENDSEQPLLMENGNGVVLGTLFRMPAGGNTAESSVGKLSADATDVIMRSHGRELVASYWGSYVAILRDPQQRVTRIIRSPLSQLACLRTTFRGVHLFFSFKPDVAATGLLNFTVNWPHIARMLSKLDQGSSTGELEVSQVRCGQCVKIGPVREESVPYWDALEAASRPPILDARVAAVAVRGTARYCVESWAKVYPRVLLRLSGGLDSTIVGACLARAHARPRVTGIHRFSSRSDCDERDEARLVAHSLGIDLIELYREPTIALDGALSAHSSERPQNYLNQFGQALQEIAIGREQGSCAVFEGTYGDQLFFNAEFHLTLADYIHDFGLRSGMFQVAHNAGRLSGYSISSVMQRALKLGLFRSTWNPFARAGAASALLAPDVLANLLGPIESSLPWFDPARYVPPGKQFHISNVSDSDAGGAPYHQPGDPARLSPLLSQPLVELCLRIPTYVHCSDGWDRRVERLAFADDIPQEIATRRSKGGQASFSNEVLAHNRSFVKELLLDGELVRNGIVVRPRLEQALRGKSAALANGAARFSKLFNIEIWFRTRQAQRLSAAA
jgi:asparagine synthase (glutamine-hydrolysing)